MQFRHGRREICFGGRPLKIDRSTRLLNFVVSDPDSVCSLELDSFSVGVFMPGQNVFLERQQAGPFKNVAKFTANFQRKVVHICFSQELLSWSAPPRGTGRRGRASGPGPTAPPLDDYKVRLHFRDLMQILEVNLPQRGVGRRPSRALGLVFRFQCAAEIFKQKREKTEEKRRDRWVQGDWEEDLRWPRTTRPLCLDGEVMGQYYDYLLVPGPHRENQAATAKLLERLRQSTDWGQGQDRHFYPRARYQEAEAKPPSVRRLDLASTERQRRRWVKQVPFPVLFVLEKMVGEGMVYHEMLSQEFYQLLTVGGQLGVQKMEKKVQRLCRALEHFRVSNTVLERPAEQLQEALHLVDENKDQGRAVVLDEAETAREHANLVPVLRMTITPLTQRCWGPELDTPNRILREYKHLADRFLRVHFTDENGDRLSVGMAGGHFLDDRLKGVKAKLKKGIWIGPRHYDFLAMSNSQLREHCCWFFASDGTTSAEHIRRWMGDFECIKVVAKYAARMGQSFSATVTNSKLVVGPTEFEEVPDIVGGENKYVFSDGIGMISEEV